MEPLSPPPSKRGSRRMSLTTFFAISMFVLVCAIILLAIGWYRNFSAKSLVDIKLHQIQAKQEQALLDQTNVAIQTAFTVAHNKQDALLQSAKNATNALGDLLAVVMRLENDLAALKTNDVGQMLSPYPDLVSQARRLYEDVARDVPPASDVVSHLEGARRVEQQLVSSLGTTYIPDTSLSNAVQDSLVWVDSPKRNANQFAALLVSLEREAKVKVSLAPIANPPTLEDAMRQLAAAEATARGQIILQKTSDAKAQAASLEAQGEVAKILAQGNTKKTDAEIEALKLATQNQVKKTDADIEAARMVEQGLRKKTDADIEALKHASQDQAKKTEADIEAQKVLDDAKKKLLREKASQPEIQAKLAPFITPGYAQVNTLGADLKPLSYTDLQNCGALRTNITGLTKLLVLAWRSADRVRPPLENEPAIVYTTPGRNREGQGGSATPRRTRAGTGRDGETPTLKAALWHGCRSANPPFPQF